MQSNTDQLPRLLCSKYPGGRSALYNKWEEEMLDAAAGKGDEPPTVRQGRMGEWDCSCSAANGRTPLR